MEEEAWKTWKIQDPKNERKINDWRDITPKLLFGFTLITNGHLCKKTIDRLKQQYDNINTRRVPRIRDAR